MRSHRINVQGFYWLTKVAICSLIFCVIAAIPKIGIFFLAPKYVMIGLSLLLMLGSRKYSFGRAWKGYPKTLLFFYLLVAVVSAIRSSSGGTIRFIEGLSVYLIIVAFIGDDKRRQMLTIRCISLVLTLSTLWLIGSTLIGEPFMSIRQTIYQSMLDRYEWAVYELSLPSGLVQAHFNMGYQLSAGVMLSLFLAFIEKGKWRLLWIISFGAMVIAVFLTSQRSIIPAMVFSGGYFLFKKRKIKHLIIAASLSLIVIVMYNNYRAISLETSTLSEKFEQSEDIRARIGWQIAAVKVILSKPFGNLGGQLNWGEESVRHGADFSNFSGNEMFVHNSYLGYMMLYGWPGVVLILGALAHVIKKIIKPSLSRMVADSPSKRQAEAVTVALIALMIQALFHNSSLFSLDPTTWVFFCVASAQAQGIRYEQKKTRLGSTGFPEAKSASI